MERRDVAGSRGSAPAREASSEAGDSGPSVGGRAVRPRQRHGVELPQLEGPVGHDAPETLTALGDAHAVAGRTPPATRTRRPTPPPHARGTKQG